LAGNANATAICDGFETCCDIDSIAEYVAVVRDDVPNIDANTKLYSILRRCIRIALSHSRVRISTAHRTASTALANSTSMPSPVVLMMCPPVFLYLGIAELTAMLFQLGKCALLVSAH
jgi:hypothetical protein